MLVLSEQEVIDQARRIVEADTAALATGGECQARGEVGFAEARVTDQDLGLGLLAVAAPRQIQHAQFSGAGQATEVEVGQVFEHGQVGRFDAPRWEVLVALHHFEFGER